MIQNKRKVAAIFAHADDEALGAGGALALHCKQGDDVCVIFLADGVGSRDGASDLDERQVAAEKACKELGISDIHYLNFPDNAMDSVPLLSIVKALEALLDEISPNVIYTHHKGDLNVDHRVTHDAVLTACRPMPGSCVEAIYACEVLSSTEWASPNVGNAFIPNHFIDISSVWDHKLRALNAYSLEMRDFPHSRSIESVTALATLRGAQVGYEKGEAFSVVRQRKSIV